MDSPRSAFISDAVRKTTLFLPAGGGNPGGGGVLDPAEGAAFEIIVFLIISCKSVIAGYKKSSVLSLACIPANGLFE